MTDTLEQTPLTETVRAARIRLAYESGTTFARTGLPTRFMPGYHRPITYEGRNYVFTSKGPADSRLEPVLAIDRIVPGVDGHIRADKKFTVDPLNSTLSVVDVPAPQELTNGPDVKVLGENTVAENIGATALGQLPQQDLDLFFVESLIEAGIAEARIRR